MSVVLSIKDLKKNYSPVVKALKGVSFDVPQGSVFGILGPNGSGKTTLLGIVMDVLRANSGSYLWFGQPGGSPEQRRKIGSLLEVLKKVNLYERRKSKFKTYSLGMKQRLAIGAALLGNPKVLVLDEPTNGLDPVGIAEIRKLIVDLKEQGHTIIMASHLLDEVEKVCTHAAILKTGNLITTGDVAEIMMEEDIVELSAADMNALLAVLNHMGKEVLLDEKAGTVQILFPKGTAKMDEINRHCFNNGVVLTQLVLRKKRLETRFFELTN